MGKNPRGERRKKWAAYRFRGTKKTATGGVDGRTETEASSGLSFLKLGSDMIFKSEKGESVWERR